MSLLPDGKIAEMHETTNRIALPILTSVFLSTVEATRAHTRLSPTQAIIRYGNNQSFLENASEKAAPQIRKETGINYHPDDLAGIFAAAKMHTESRVADSLRQTATNRLRATPVKLHPITRAGRPMNKYQMAEYLNLRADQVVTQTMANGELCTAIGILDVYPLQAPVIEQAPLRVGYDPLLFLVNRQKARQTGVNPNIFAVIDASFRTAVRTSLLALHDYDMQQAMKHILVNSPHLLPYNKPDDLRDRARILRTCGDAVLSTFDDFVLLTTRLASRGQTIMRAPQLIVAAETLDSFWHGVDKHGRPIGQPLQMQAVLTHLENLSRGK